MWKNIGAILMLIVTIYFAAGCTSNSYEFNPAEYTFPSGDIMQGYEIIHGSSQEEEGSSKYDLMVFEVDDGYLTDEEKQAIFEEWRIAKEEQDKYDAYLEAWSKDSFYVSEQKRIESYCEEYGFFGCYDIRYVCEDEYTCKRVFSECEETDFDPDKLVYHDNNYYNKGKDCDQWDIHIEDTDFDIRHVDEDFIEEGGYQW